MDKENLGIINYMDNTEIIRNLPFIKYEKRIKIFS